MFESRFQKILNWIDKYGRLVGLISSIGTLIGIIVAVVSLSSSLKILENQENDFAWSTITNPRPGNSGMGSALRHLNEKGIFLDRIYMKPIGLISAANAQKISEPRPKVYIGAIKLDGIKLRNAWLNNTNFSEASLNHADMREVMIEGADFSKAKLEFADLRKARGKNVILVGSFMGKTKLGYASLPEAKLNNARMINANAKKINLKKANALATRFDGTNLSEGVLSEIYGLGASFVKSILNEVNMEAATLGGASFEDASLKGANLTNASASYANFTNADMTGSNVSFATFTGANLSNIKMTDAKGLSDATWRGAWVWDDNITETNHDDWIKIVSGFRVYDKKCRNDWEKRVKSVERKSKIKIIELISRYDYPPIECLKKKEVPSAVK